MIYVADGTSGEIWECESFLFRGEHLGAVQENETLELESPCPDCPENEEYSYVRRGPHIGLYCGSCGRWIKWAPKREVPPGLDL